jgi:U4/U6 small nuclear ribonucleoprotein PRP3
VIFNPAFNMVYIEWATKLMRSYRRLILHWIACTEAARARGEEEVELAEDDEDDEDEASETGQERAGWRLVKSFGRQ